MDAVEIFLRGVWKIVPDEEDLAWVDRLAIAEGSNAPLGDFGLLIREMLDKGVSPYSIARFAKIIGYETAHGICYHLNDPIASYEGFPVELNEIAWGLFQVDQQTGEPIKPLYGLHETLLSLDPSEREMRPKSR